MISVGIYIFASFFLFLLGLYCLSSKYNILKLLMAIEIMMCSATLNFVALASCGVYGLVDSIAQAYAVISIAVGGSVIAVGLSIAFYAHKHAKSLDITKLKKLKW